MRKKKHSVSDSTLMRLWRQAVLAYWNYTDPLSGDYDPTGETLQCHHIVKRKHFVLRWDYRNGVPLTIESHQRAHTASGHAELWDKVDSEYLERFEGYLKKDYLQSLGINDDEFRLLMKDELKAVIEARV